MPFAQVIREFLAGGVTSPWTLLASLFLGVFLLTTPVTLGVEGPLYFSDHVVGCLVITIAVTALAEVTRAVRFFNVPLGLWVAVSPFLLAGAGGLSATSMSRSGSPSRRSACRVGEGRRSTTAAGTASSCSLRRSRSPR